MTKTENLKKAYKAIKDGNVIVCNGCRIWIDYSRSGRQLIFWYCYGSSAEPIGLSNLRFVMKVIAGSDDYSFDISNH